LPGIIADDQVTEFFAAPQIPKVSVTRQGETVRVKAATGALHQEIENLIAGGIDVDHLLAEAVRVYLAIDGNEDLFIRFHSGAPFIAGMMGVVYRQTPAVGDVGRLGRELREGFRLF
jgi:hypothetical protein